jgi:hypothetical protein
MKFKDKDRTTVEEPIIQHKVGVLENGYEVFVKTEKQWYTLYYSNIMDFMDDILPTMKKIEKGMVK